MVRPLSLIDGGKMRTLRSSTAIVIWPLVVAAASAAAFAQTYKSQIEHPIVRYKMSARFDPEKRLITGHYTLTWWNHTEDTIPDLYFHLYWNAFKNADSTLFREKAIKRRPAEIPEWLSRPGREKWGWVTINKISIVGGADLTKLQTFVHPDDANAQDETVERIELPQPIPPHGTIQLEVDFTSKLPRALDRAGYEGDYNLMAQWFPKIGVYEAAGERGRAAGGWNCHQYHTNTEFYADYGVYDVDLTTPSNYVVGATGFLRSQHPNSDSSTTSNFYQEDVHDFAWTASPRFHKLTRTFDWNKEVSAQELVRWAGILRLPADQIALRNVQVNLLLEPDHLGVADRYFRALFNGLKYFGLWYGQYPYDTLTVVDVPRESATCCMEYPTFITVATSFWPGKHEARPEGVTVHEFGHQFWYGLVGNNEFEEAWLDEGFNTYSTGKVIETAYGNPCHYERVFGMPVPAYPWLEVSLPDFPFAGVGKVGVGPYFSCVKEPERTSGRGDYLAAAKDDDLVRNGWQYLDGTSYVENSYGRTGLTMRTLESYLGEDVMARVMRTYQQRWRYRHPSTRDFINVVNEVSGRDMNWFFQQFFYNSDLTDYAVAGIRNEPVLGKIGLYDEDGKQVYYPREVAEAAFESAPKLYRSTVVVRRLGEAEAPVDVTVHFEHGAVEHEHWDGQYRWTKFVYERPDTVVSAEVDPGRKLALEANLTNNSLVMRQDNRGAAKWYVRWIFWLENLFFSAGFFS
jgi:Peptidase family M1 domain